MKTLNYLLILLLNCGLVNFNILSEEVMFVPCNTGCTQYVQNLVDILTKEEVSLYDSLVNMRQNCAKIRSEICSSPYVNDFNLNIELGCERLVTVIESFAKTTKPNFSSVAKLPVELERLKEEILGKNADKKNFNFNASFYQDIENTFKNVHKRSNMNKIDLANLLIKKIKNFQTNNK